MIPRRNIMLCNNLFFYFYKWFLNLFFRKDYFLKFENLFDGKVFLLSRGRFALDLIFNSIKYKEKSEIIIPNFYLKELVPILKKKKLKVILCDINNEDLSFNLNQLISKINNKTKFIILSHMFGICGNVNKIIAEIKKKKKDIIIIEDCAHSFGSKFNNKNLGIFGDFSLFSFDYIKPLNLFSGGALLVNNEKYYEFILKNYKYFKKPKKITILKKIFYYIFQNLFLKTPLFIFIKNILKNKKTRKILEQFHKSNKYEFEKLSSFQAMMGFYELNDFFNKLNNLDKIRQRYIQIIKKIPNVKILKKDFCTKYSQYSFYILTNKNSKIIENKMHRLGIDVGIKDEVMNICSSDINKYPNSIKLYNEIIQLPFYISLNDKKIMKICNALNEAVNK